MPELSDVEMYKDGGTILFRLTGSDVDGQYRLQTPYGSLPQPLFRDEVKLGLGSPVEAAVLRVLEEWHAAASSDEARQVPPEADGIRVRLTWLTRMHAAQLIQYVVTTLANRVEVGSRDVGAV